MRKIGFALIIVVCSWFAAALPMTAHHAFAAVFDSKMPIKLTGTVTKIEWQNPHTWFYIDVKGDNGNAANWAMEMGSPNLLIRSGWTKNSMKIGDVVSVEGFRAKDGSNNGNAQVVILTNTGQRLFAGSSLGQPVENPQR
jgi:hypothetical protein